MTNTKHPHKHFDILSVFARITVAPPNFLTAIFLGFVQESEVAAEWKSGIRSLCS